jgi:hypothetical protein
MAEKRMFAKTIIDSDAFLDMPVTAQLLYFHLSMRADDDGFVNKPKAIMRLTGCKDDDLKILFAKKFLIPFDSGVVVIKHWRIHNYIRKDTYTETKYKEEKDQLEMDENNAYRLVGATPLQLSDGYVTGASTQVSIGKVSIDKISKEECSVPDPEEPAPPTPKRETSHTTLARLLPEYGLSDMTAGKVSDWITYKSERREAYKEQGLRSLLSQISRKAATYGEQAVCDLIDECMANGWKGIIFDRLQQRQPERRNGNGTDRKAPEGVQYGIVL